ncbi:hypothetical protein TM4_54 [Mycobacterium phage TM4]|uniref:Uncharacterized protein n=1 Tax=Mycobacterium phage TM4 TaxID=88870 RepID=Q9ZX24_BPMT4|nr:hypothetical protein TM4_gp54 [Mycobacterium phage TM4]AAD17621.1 hypothetical protein TM4_54 [Mycobacterium phage TM4]AGK85705.1 hypothetical protein 33D_0023 [Mycobacterium phage 33D]
MSDISSVKGHVDLLRYVKAEKAKLKEIEDAAKAAVEEALGGDDEGTIDGEVVVRRKRIKSNRLDQKLLKSLHPEAHAECMSMSESTRFEVVE